MYVLGIQLFVEIETNLWVLVGNLVIVSIFILNFNLHSNYSIVLITWLHYFLSWLYFEFTKMSNVIMQWMWFFHVWCHIVMVIKACWNYHHHTNSRWINFTTNNDGKNNFTPCSKSTYFLKEYFNFHIALYPNYWWYYCIFLLLQNFKICP